MNIKGRVVTLRAPEFADMEKLHAWSNDPEIWSLLGGWHFPFSSRSTTDWIKSRADNNLNGHVFCIEAPDIGLIGTANLVNIDWKNRNAFHGMMLGNVDMRGKGYALDTVMAIMRYAFDELGLRRLDGDMIATNHRSIAFYVEKCGWQREGVRRDWFFRGGRFHDKVIVGVTREDYERLLEKTRYWDQGAG